MRLLALLLLTACSGDRQRFGVQQVSDGEGEPSTLPLFSTHPDALVGVDAGWVEVDGRTYYRLEAAEVTDHTLYDFDADGAVYLAGFEDALLKVPSLWVPPVVRHKAEWFQPEIERTVYVERGYAPGEWTFQYAVAGLAPEFRTRVEDPTPTGFYEAEAPTWSSEVLSWSRTGSVAISPAPGAVIFAEGPPGTSLTSQAYRQEFDEFGFAGVSAAPIHTDPSIPDMSAGNGGPWWPTRSGWLGAALAGGAPVEALPLPQHTLVGFQPEGVRRGSDPEHAHIVAAPSVSNYIPVPSLALVDSSSGLLGAVRDIPDLHESRLFRDDAVEVRYYSTSLSGRIDRYALTPDGWERTSLGRIAIDDPELQLTSVWERLDGTLEGLLGPVVVANSPQTGVRIQIDAPRDPEPVPVLPGMIYGAARVLFWPSDDRLLCGGQTTQFDTPANTPSAAVGSCRLDFTHRLEITGTHDELGPFRFDAYTSGSAEGNDTPVRHILHPQPNGMTLAVDRAGDGFDSPTVLLDENLLTVSSAGGEAIGNCQPVWPDGCWERAPGRDRWHRNDGRVVLIDALQGQLFLLADAPVLLFDGEDLYELDDDGTWDAIVWPGGNLRFANAAWLCVGESNRGPMTCHARDGDEVIAVPGQITAVGTVVFDEDGTAIDPETLQPLPDAEPAAFPVDTSGLWERDGVVYRPGPLPREVFRYVDGRSERAILPPGPTPQAPFAVTPRFLYVDGNRTPIESADWQPMPQ